MTHFLESFTKPSYAFGPLLTGFSIDAYAWQTRVVGRNRTGVLYFSEYANASCIISYASSGEDGSNTGIRAKSANRLVSCSVWEEIGPGSSADTTTMPPFTPTYASDISGSAATFKPTCFIVTIVRAPPYAALAATSIAAFSFTDHSKCTPSCGYLDIVSTISEDGVPGYPDTRLTPAANAPSAIAPFPITYSCM